jgi:hypothetical protein
MYSVWTSSKLQLSRAAEEEVFGLEIRQRNDVRYVEFPLTRCHNSKCGSGARKKRGRGWRIGERRGDAVTQHTTACVVYKSLI